MKPKIIPEPKLTGAKKLGGLEMNRFHFNSKHTVLTPDQLRKMASEQPCSRDVRAERPHPSADTLKDG